MTEQTVNKITVSQELEVIRKAHGGVLYPSDVVAYAKDESTALHSCFTWDDDKAAAEYRLWQARQIIRVTVTVLAADMPSTRAYVSFESDRHDDGGYRSMVDVLSSARGRKALLFQAKSEMERFEAKYKALVELTDVFSAMRRVRKAH